MTKVIHLSSPPAGKRVQTSAQSTMPGMANTASGLDRITNPVDRQAAIENSLSMALYLIRQPGNNAANLWVATARASRALTLLKQASQGDSISSPSNTLERA